MLPTLRLKGLLAFVGDQGDLRPACAAREDAPDGRDGEFGYGTGEAGGVGSGEEEFVIFSAVEGLLNGCAAVDGKGGGVNFSSDAGLLAEVGQVSGEAVAEVEGSRGESASGEPESLGDARLGIEMGGEQISEGL